MSRIPIKNSKVTVAVIIFLIFWGVFWCLYWAVYFIVAWSTPRLLITWIRFGADRAIPTSPYSPSFRIPATIIMDMAEISDDTATPQKRLNPPFAEVFANLKAALKLPFSF